MIGWVRRAEEREKEDKRRAKEREEYLQWLETLTPEQLFIEERRQEQLSRQEDAFFRKLTYGSLIIVGFFILFFLCHIFNN